MHDDTYLYFVKTLYIVRHAKSSWKDPDLDDLDRPLNERGEKDAPRMGKRLKEKEISPELIYTSPSVRTLTTAKIITEILGCSVSQIHVLDDLYHASEKKLLRILQGVPDQTKSLMLVGHNPGLTEFVNDLLDEDLENIPTAGVVAAELNISKWKDAEWKCGEMVFFDYPRR